MGPIETQIGLELSDGLADQLPNIVNQDEAWFVERPGRHWRARPPHPHETDFRADGRPSALSKRRLMLIHRPWPRRHLKVLVGLRGPGPRSQRDMVRTARRCLGSLFELGLEKLESLPEEGDVNSVTFVA